jgi:hypothetical protein
VQRIKGLLAAKVSTSQKKLLLDLSRSLSIRNLVFKSTLGAVKTETPEIVITELSHPSQKAIRKLELLNRSIHEANIRKFWPVRRKLRFIDGMSGQSYRYVLNRMLSVDKNYLEIGTWRGSTACSALDGNQISAWLIDDWSEFGGPAGDALKNVSEFVGLESRLNVISNDFKKVDYSALIDGEVDTYLFDGPHSREDHINGVKVINQLRFDTLVFIVDDWCWEDVREGTLAGLEEVHATVVFKVEILPKSKKRFQFSRWHNGYCFFILDRS